MDGENNGKPYFLVDDFGNIYLSTIQNPPKHPKKKQILHKFILSTASLHLKIVHPFSVNMDHKYHHLFWKDLFPSTDLGFSGGLTMKKTHDSYCWWFRNPKQPP